MKKEVKKKIISYIRKHPFAKFSAIIQNAGATKNHNSLKKYLKELVVEDSIKYIEYYDAYLVLPVRKRDIRSAMFALVTPMILEGIHKLDIDTRKELIKIDNNFDTRKFDIKSTAIKKRVLFKFYKLFHLKKSLLETEFRIIYETNRVKKKELYMAIDDMINFGERFRNFLDEYEKITKKKLHKIERELNQEYAREMEYALKIWKSKRNMNEIMALAITEQIKDTKEASKVHLEVRRQSKRREIEEIDSSRKYPKKLTSTNRMISKLFSDKGVEGKMPDIDEIILGYQSELGRQGVKGVTPEILNIFAIAYALRSFLNDEKRNSAKDKKIKKEIEKTFSKLRTSKS